MRFYRFMGFIMAILGKIIIVVIFVVSGIVLDKVILESEEDDYWKQV